MAQKKLECRIVIIHRTKIMKTEIGMFDPKTCRYEFLGLHGWINGEREIDKAVRDLKSAIERAGHHLTFCERTE